MSVLDDTKLNLLVSLLSWSFEECEVLVYRHYSLVHSLSESHIGVK